MTWREKLRSHIIAYILAHPGIDMKQVAAETGYSTKTLRNWMVVATGIKRPVGRPKKEQV
jgi:lambda repressor-like predicted transcriptional regulator